MSSVFVSTFLVSTASKFIYFDSENCLGSEKLVRDL